MPELLEAVVEVVGERLEPIEPAFQRTQRAVDGEVDELVDRVLRRGTGG